MTSKKLFYIIYYLFAFLLSIISIILMIGSIFEYSMGLDDIDLLEFLLIFLMFFLSIRIFKNTKKNFFGIKSFLLIVIDAFSFPIIFVLTLLLIDVIVSSLIGKAVEFDIKTLTLDKLSIQLFLDEYYFIIASTIVCTHLYLLDFTAFEKLQNQGKQE